MDHSVASFNILIVDDNRNNLFTLRALLGQFRECCVIEAESGEEALSRTLESRIDLILLNVQMPGMDGFETARHLQMTERTRNIPIIFVTAVFKAEEFIQRGYAVGAVDYLVKPIDDNLLCNRIRLHLRVHEREMRLREALESLRQSEERFRFAIEASREGLWDWHIANETVYFSPRYEMIHGYAPGSLPPNYHSLELGVYADDLQGFRQALQGAVAGEITNIEIEHRAVCADGSKLWVQTCGKVVAYDEASGRPVRIVGTRTDISMRKAVENQTRLSSLVLENLSDCVMLLDERERIVSVNPAIERIYGYTPQEVIGKTPGVLQSGRHDTAFFDEMRTCIKASGHWQGEIWNRRKNGEIYPEWLSVSAFPSEGESSVFYVCVYSDPSSQVNLRKHLHYLAYYDPLTELPNRALYQDRLLDTLSLAKRERGLVGVMFIDLDRFKAINDTLGHHVGDELLKIVAQRIKNCLRESDTVARLGGDEFSIVLYPIEGVSSVLTVANKIIDVINPQIQVGDNVMQVGASIGISVYPQDGETMDVLLRNADTAMYKAKEEGRNRYRLFSKELFDATLDRYTLELELGEALKTGQFRVYFQALVKLDSGEITGVEALVRWQHPSRGLLAPESFIHLAESIGLITEIDAWVMQEACKQVLAWDAMGLEVPRIAVNIAGKDIAHSDLSTWVAECLASAGLPPQRLELEVGESFFMKNETLAIASLERLREMGVGIAIDDFGAGYSSLSRIKRLPVDRLKIDQSFIRDIGRDLDGENIVKIIIALGNYLCLQISAEGVEEETQRRFLLDNGCREGQGHWFGYPVPAEEFAKIWLERGRLG